MRIHNVWADEQGVSHFRDIEVEWAEVVRASRRSKVWPVSGLVFRETGGDYDLDWHTAPRRQFVVNLDAGVAITVGDGETRVIGPGEVLLVEDTHGQGHVSRAVAGAMRHSLFIHCA